jgi:hypothetical protein
MALHIDCTGLTVYMTREALQKLAAELSRISDAPPQECFEIHLRSAFSQFDENENYAGQRSNLPTDWQLCLKGCMPQLSETQSSGARLRLMRCRLPLS